MVDCLPSMFRTLERGWGCMWERETDGGGRERERERETERVV
jgi:hypothetical protein